MGKHVRNTDGTRTALVFLGWIAFVVGVLFQAPFAKLVLLATARVLP